ncbi:unnamed protein product [Sympodiomycopsis kandeliae]
MARSSNERTSSSSSSKRKRSSKDSEAAVSAAESSADESFVSARSSSKGKSHKSSSKSDKHSKNKDSKKSRTSQSSPPKAAHKKLEIETTDAETDDYASAHDGESVPSSSKGKSSSHVTKSEQYLRGQPLSSAFEIQYPVITLSIPPIHASQPTVALSEIFDSLVMRFIPPLNGVLVSHGESYFLVDGKVSKDEKDVPPSAIIDSDGAFASVRAGVECCVWRPRIGQKIQGRITLSTPSHVSLLIHSTFNASIPSNHMEDYEYVEGHSGNAASNEDEEGDEEMLDGNDQDDDGYWRHKKTKERLGGSTDGLVTFIVIGLTISSPSLSLTGSLLSKPFSIPPPRSTMNLTSQTANTYGIGNSADSGPTSAKVTFAADTNEDDAAAIKKATRKVRWEEDDDYTTTDGEHTDTDVEREQTSGRHVKF